jgi:hypothetical protein
VNRRPRSRAGRALLWVLLIILALIVLSVLFGGFQKGTNSGSLNMLRGGPHGYTHAARLG